MSLKKIAPVCAGLILMIGVSAISAPRLTIASPEFQFGYSPQNAKISHVYWLKSTGDEDLKILKVIPGCGCTQAPLEKDILPPGDSTRLEVIFSTQSYTNRMSKSPKIETNEGAQPQSVIFYTFVVARPDSTYPVVINPYKLDLSQFTEKVRDEITFTITNVSEQDLAPSMVEYPERMFLITLPKVVKKGESAEGVLKLKESAAGTSFEKSFTIGFDDEKASRFTIPVKRTMRDPSKN